MNIDSRYELVDRYYNGLTTAEEGTTLTEAVESDPDVLAYLCENAELEACLQKQLAPPDRPRAAPPRLIIPFWHWRRSGKWLAAGAAAAALAVSAAVVLWPHRGGGGEELAQEKPAFSVKRFASGSYVPLQAGPQEPMEEVEFEPGEKWIRDFRRFHPPEAIPGDVQLWRQIATPDEQLLHDLQAGGVLFPAGSSVQWLPGGKVFVAKNTAANLARLEAFLKEPFTGLSLTNLEATVWRFTPGSDIPSLLAEERILSRAEVQARRPAHYGHAATGPVTGGTLNFTAFVAGGTATCAEVSFSKAGNRVTVSGLAANPPHNILPPDRLEALADMEFSVTLAEGEGAVLHLRGGAGGPEWVMLVQANQVPAPQMVELGQDPEGGYKNMRFDKEVLTVKAGLPVRLHYKNDKCALAHNFLLIKPGTTAAVGQLADQMMALPDAMARCYIPESSDIIVASKTLLYIGKSEDIDFIAPSEPGDYPCLCTFPGHWRRQQAILRVVK